MMKLQALATAQVAESGRSQRLTDGITIQFSESSSRQSEAGDIWKWYSKQDMYKHSAAVAGCFDVVVPAETASDAGLPATQITV